MSVRGAVHRRIALVLLAGALTGAGCGGAAAPTPTSNPATPPRGPAVVARNRAGPRLLDLTVRSPALGARAHVRLLLPRGYRAGDGRRWPVLYLLHGCCDDFRSWTRSTGIASMRALGGTLVVMPDGGPVGFYSDWRDGPAWETFHLTELPRLLEREFGARRPMAVAGLSMGGLGAMVYAARRPRRFDAAASLSGILHPLADPDWVLGLLAANTPDPRAVWGDPEADRATWAAHDPVELARHLRGVRLFVSAGDGRPGPLDGPDAGRDQIEPVVERQSRAFARRLRALGIPAETDFYGPGHHDWPYWERELRRALPLLLGRG